MQFFCPPRPLHTNAMRPPNWTHRKHRRGARLQFIPAKLMSYPRPPTSSPSSWKAIDLRRFSTLRVQDAGVPGGTLIIGDQVTTFSATRGDMGVSLFFFLVVVVDTVSSFFGYLRGRPGRRFVVVGSVVVTGTRCRVDVVAPVLVPIHSFGGGVPRSTVFFGLALMAETIGTFLPRLDAVEVSLSTVCSLERTRLLFVSDGIRATRCLGVLAMSTRALAMLLLLLLVRWL